MVGLIPLFAVETIEPALLAALPDFKERLEWFLQHRPEDGGARVALARARSGRATVGGAGAWSPHEAALETCADPSEFLGDYGVRALSKYHERQPFVLHADGQEQVVAIRARRVVHRSLWRQLELARPDLVSSQLPLDRIVAKVPPLLR